MLAGEQDSAKAHTLKNTKAEISHLKGACSIQATHVSVASDPTWYLWGRVVSPAQRTVDFCEEHKASQHRLYVHKSSLHLTPLCWGPALTAHQQKVKEKLQIHQL